MLKLQPNFLPCWAGRQVHRIQAIWDTSHGLCGRSLKFPSIAEVAETHRISCQNCLNMLSLLPRPGLPFKLQTITKLCFGNNCKSVMFEIHIWGGKQISFLHLPRGLGRVSCFVWPVLVSHCFGASALHFLAMQIAIAWSMWLSVQCFCLAGLRHWYQWSGLRHWHTKSSDLASDTGTQSPVVWPPTLAHKVQWSGLRHWHTKSSDLASDTGTQSPVIWPPTLALTWVWWAHTHLHTDT